MPGEISESNGNLVYVEGGEKNTVEFRIRISNGDLEFTNVNKGGRTSTL